METPHRFQPPDDAVGKVPPTNRLELHVTVEIDETHEPFKIEGRRGLMYMAQITECSSPHGFNRDALTKLLVGQRIAGRGTIVGVESFATMSLGAGPSGRIGLLIDGP